MAGVACDFIEGTYGCARDAVQELLDAAAGTCDGRLWFYSAPGGCGRNIEYVGMAAPPKADFRLVARSKGAAVSCGQNGTSSYTALLQAALAEGVAFSGQLAAAVVRHGGGIVEGVLLVEGPESPSAWSLNGEDVKPKTALAAAAATLGICLPAKTVRLWARVLGERLEKMYWQAEAQRSAKALGSVLDILKQMVEDVNCNEILRRASNMIPLELLQASLTSDGIALWAYDRDAQEVVMNNSGNLDGMRVPVEGSIVGESVKNGESPVYGQPSRTLQADSGTSPERTLCIPIKHLKLAKKEQISFQVAVGVVQHVYYKKDDAGVNAMAENHFDMVTAERLPRSALPELLTVRDSLVHIVNGRRQRYAIQELIGELASVESVTEASFLVETKMCTVLDCEKCTVFFVDSVNREAWAPPTERRSYGIFLTFEDGIVGHVASKAGRCPDETGVVMTNNLASCPWWKGDVSEEFVTRNVMTAPVFGTNKQLLGIIQTLNKCVGPDNCIEADSSSGFTESDVKLMEMLAQAFGDYLKRNILKILVTRAQLDDEEGNVMMEDFVSEYYQKKSRADDAPHTIYRHSENSTDSYSNVIKNPTSRPIRAPRNSLDVNINSWEIDYWSLSRDDDYSLFLHALQEYDLITVLQLPSAAISNFFHAVKGAYHVVPYHNFRHAIATVHYAFKLMRVTEVDEYLSIADIFAVLVGALCHDIDHRGRNNAFEIMTCSEIAIRYNDSSPLENNHCSRAFQIALGGNADASCNIFSTLSKEYFNSVRRQMIAGILSTDMKHHGAHVNLMQQFVLPSELDAGSGQFIVELLIHTADIANAIMPPNNSARFSALIAEEFTLQVTEERSLGIPVTSFMDGLTDNIACAKSTLGFIDFVMKPLLVPMMRVFPQVHELGAFLEQNREELTLVVPQSPTRAK